MCHLAPRCPRRAPPQAGLLPMAALEWTGTEPFALTSFALSLLLVFRTNASYSRRGGAPACLYSMPL